MSSIEDISPLDTSAVYIVDPPRSTRIIHPLGLFPSPPLLGPYMFLQDFYFVNFIEILDQANNLNKPTRALNYSNAQNAGRSINIHNMNTLQSALEQLDIEHP